MDRRSTNDQEPADAAGDEREGRASGLLRALPDAVLICDVDGTILEANAEAEKLFGYAADELVGIAVEQLIPAELGAVHRRHRQRYSATSHPRPMITGEGIEAVRGDGVRVPVEVNLASVDLPDGPAVVASVRDLTEARRAARSLRAAHDLLSGVLAGATEQAVIATDLDGRIDLFSAGAERMLGWAALEIVGKPVSVLADPDGATDPWGLTRRYGSARAESDSSRTSAVAGTRPWAVVTRGGERRLVAMSVTVRPARMAPPGCSWSPPTRRPASSVRRCSRPVRSGSAWSSRTRRSGWHSWVSRGSRSAWSSAPTRRWPRCSAGAARTSWAWR